MKKLFYLIAILFISCTKVIDLELKTEEQKLVVEGLITDRIEPFRVKLTLLSPYFSDENPFVTNASVFITDGSGSTDTLYYTSEGYYQTSANRQGIQGMQYTLRILHEGKEYTASSTIPSYKMELDTIGYIYNEGSAFIEPGYNVIINGLDNGSTVDFYRFQFWKNGVIQTDPFKYFVVDDVPVQGNYIIAQVPYNYQSGDTARAEIQSIDENYYKFLLALSTQLQSTGGPFDAPPSNPATNVSNGALGYFAAISSDIKEIIIP